MDPAATDAPHVLVVTGMSGAGRSSAAKILEDLDYSVIDNLPPRPFSSWQFRHTTSRRLTNTSWS